MATWRRFEVHLHGFGRRPCLQDGPAQGLLNWPDHRWTKITKRPLGLKTAQKIAMAQVYHAVVTPWSEAGNVFDNGKRPYIPKGWWPADAQTMQDPRGPAKDPLAP